MPPISTTVSNSSLSMPCKKCVGKNCTVIVSSLNQKLLWANIVCNTKGWKVSVQKPYSQESRFQTKTRLDHFWINCYCFIYKMVWVSVKCLKSRLFENRTFPDFRQLLFLFAVSNPWTGFYFHPSINPPIHPGLDFLWGWSQIVHFININKAVFHRADTNSHFLGQLCSKLLVYHFCNQPIQLYSDFSTFWNNQNLTFLYKIDPN